jgi:glucoamylase
MVNEVFWPSTGRPQIRDLNFIVARDGEWWDLAQLDSYEVSVPQPYVLLPTIRHQGDDFSVTLDVVCDDLRDVVLIRFRLEGDRHRLYAVLTPRLGSGNENNSAWIGGRAFYAQSDGLMLSLRADVGFDRQSVGYVGHSDGLLDFNRHGEMTWSYRRAKDGNVAMIGELAANDGVLALSFSTRRSGVETLARSSLAEGFEPIWKRVVEKWEDWGSNWDPPAELEERYRTNVDLSTAVLKSCEDRLFPGAVVASLSVPWGNTRTGVGAYFRVWSRDSVESAFGMIAVGHFREARQLIAYLMATQREDGHWTQNFHPSGKPYRTAVQLDQSCYPILLIAKLRDLHELGELSGVDETVYRAIAFLVRAGPVTPQDRWEENEGISVFTVSLIVAAIVGGAELIHDEREREYAFSYADYLNRRIEDWLYVEGTELDRKHSVMGHYLRLATPDIFFTDRHGQVPIANHVDLKLPATDLVSMDFMCLARVGLRRANDERILDTLKVSEAELRVETPNGPCFYRYNHDGYGEHADGSPFDGTGIGRLWPLITGERGHLAIQLGEDVDVYLDALCRMTGRGGMLPEQIWDGEPIPEKRLYPGKPTGSAMPLLWAEAEFVKLATASITGEAVELLDSVRRRYGCERPEPSTWHWRTDAPFVELPSGKNLLIEAQERFRLQFGFDGWQHEADRESESLGFGMYGITLRWDVLQHYQWISFSLLYLQREIREQHEYSVEIASAPTSLHSRTAMSTSLPNYEGNHKQTRCQRSTQT